MRANLDIQRILQNSFPDVSGINTDGITGMFSSVTGFFSELLNSVCGSLGIETDINADDIGSTLSHHMESSFAGTLDAISGSLDPLLEIFEDGKITGDEFKKLFNHAAEGTAPAPDPAQTADPAQPVSAPAPAGQ